MRRKNTYYLLIAFSLLALFLPLSAQAAAPIHLGTIPYQGDKLIMINATHNIDLTILYSPVNNGLRFNNLGFNSLMNQTAYSFFSNTLIFDYRFINDTKTFYLQEPSTSQIYTFSIDYHNATVPADPWKTNYTSLLSRYNNTLAAFALANSSLGNMSSLWNSTIARMNSTIENMSKRNIVNESILVNMSLNVSLIQSSYNALWRDKRALETDSFIIEVILVLFIPTSVILALYLAKRSGFMNTEPTSGKSKRWLDIGYGPLQDWHDKRIIKKNDKITKRKEQELEEKPIERQTIQQPKEPIFVEVEQERPIPIPASKSSSTFSTTADRIDQMLIEKGFSKKQPQIETKPKTGEQKMKSQVKIIRRMYEEGSSPSEITKLTGFDAEDVNAICNSYKDSD